MTRRVEIIGGGPAGAFTSRLLALRHPDWRVRLFERLPPDDTFGFGVGLTHGLVRGVEDADAEVTFRLLAAAHSFRSMRFEVPQGTAEFGQSHHGAIRRAELLRILLDSAAEAGAEVVIGRSVTVDELSADADLVVGADGLSSEVRAKFADEFGAETRQSRGAFIWCGAEVELDGTVFTPAETDAGTFVAHAYPYDHGLSTLVIEASQETVERAGFTGRTWSSDGESDDEALAYLSDAFSGLLKGRKLFGNRSRWGHFTTLTCSRWHIGNVVLLGDAAATVHPSLGSGTKVALESAIALADAIDETGDAPLSAALPVFERNRRSKVERLQDSAQRSRLWWESFTERADLSPSRLAVAYLSRAGVVSMADLVTAVPELASQASADYAGVAPGQVRLDDITGWVLDNPIETDGVRFPRRIVEASVDAATIEIECGDAWGPRADPYVEQARAHVRAGARLIRLTGGDSRLAALDRFAVAERLRRELPVVVGVAIDDRHVDLAVAGLVAGRTDLLFGTADSLSLKEGRTTMSNVVSGLRLAEQAILKMVQAAVLEARKREAPVGVAIVDTSGLLRALVLMDGAVPIVQDVVPKKARTAAYIGSPTGEMDPALAARLTAAATDFTDLRGGLPVVADGVVVGGIAASGSSSDNDVAIAQAGLDALST